MSFRNSLRSTVYWLNKRMMSHTISPKKNRPFTIFVEGNIGSGKTTFLNHFSNANVDLLAEPVEMWRNVEGHNLLGMMYKEPSRWGMPFQSYVQLSMTDLHTRPSKHPVKLMERSIYSARYCFVENLSKEGLIADCEYIVLDEWFKWITSNLNVGGDLIVYLRTHPEVVYERMRARARKEENSVSLDYLTKLHELHEDWLYNQIHFECPAPVIVLDANRDVEEMEEEYHKCEQRIPHLQHNRKEDDSAASTAILA